MEPVLDREQIDEINEFGGIEIITAEFGSEKYKLIDIEYFRDSINWKITTDEVGVIWLRNNQMAITNDTYQFRVFSNQFDNYVWLEKFD